MVFQDPMTSLNPVLRIARQLVEAMTAHGRFTARAARERAIALLRPHGRARRRSGRCGPTRTSFPAACGSA